MSNLLIATAIACVADRLHRLQCSLRCSRTCHTGGVVCLRRRLDSERAPAKWAVATSNPGWFMGRWLAIAFYTPKNLRARVLLSSYIWQWTCEQDMWTVVPAHVSLKKNIHIWCTSECAINNAIFGVCECLYFVSARTLFSHCIYNN